jgi:hypothetical protein
MDLFGETLKKLANRLLGESQKKQLVARTLSECLGVAVSEDMFFIKDTSLILKLPPTIKAAALLKKDFILKTLSEKGIEITIIA